VGYSKTMNAVTIIVIVLVVVLILILLGVLR